MQREEENERENKKWSEVQNKRTFWYKEKAGNRRRMLLSDLWASKTRTDTNVGQNNEKKKKRSRLEAEVGKKRTKLFFPHSSYLYLHTDTSPPVSSNNNPGLGQEGKKVQKVRGRRADALSHIGSIKTNIKKAPLPSAEIPHLSFLSWCPKRKRRRRRN